jgi:hypothetical protein
MSFKIKLKSFVILSNDLIDDDEIEDDKSKILNIRANNNQINIKHIGKDKELIFKFDNVERIFKSNHLSKNSNDKYNDQDKILYNLSDKLQIPISKILHMGFNSTILLSSSSNSNTNKTNNNTYANDSIVSIIKPILKQLYEFKSLPNNEIILSQTIKITCYELINDNLRDLIKMSTSSSKLDNNKLKIRKSKINGTFIDGLLEITCIDLNQLISLITSSLEYRSHLSIVTDNINIENSILIPINDSFIISNAFINIQINSTILNSNDNSIEQRKSNLEIISLAPIEALNYKLNPNDIMLVTTWKDIISGFVRKDDNDMNIINDNNDSNNNNSTNNAVKIQASKQNSIQSLSTLTRVINLLKINRDLLNNANTNLFDISKIEQHHIPYRDSILTRILQPTLEGGKSSIYMISILDNNSMNNICNILRFSSEISGKKNYIYIYNYYSFLLLFFKQLL